MSQKLENIFKEALQNQEVPFDATAWDALRSRLDKTMPVAGKKPFGPKAATILAVGVLGAASIWYFATGSNTKSENDTKIAQKEELKSQENQASTFVDKENISLEKSASVDNNQTTSNQKDSDSYSKKDGTSQKIPYTGPGKSSSNTSSNGAEENFITDKSNLVLPKNPVYYNPDAPIANTSQNIEVPFIATSCQYEETKITNTSDVNITVEFPSGKSIVVLPKKSKKIQLTDAGMYRVSNTSGVEKSFIVHENRPVDFTIDTDNKYNNGVPTTEVILTSSANKAIWYSTSGNQSYTGNTAEFHFFKKGAQVINLKATNTKGCVTEVTKTINIADNYNLMAATAFLPQDIDPRNNKFMPYALTVRETKFNLIIINPKDGTVVYETSDASAGWDGIDRKTGKPAVHASTYIWKVTLENPLPGESNDYKGTVMVTIN